MTIRYARDGLRVVRLADPPSQAALDRLGGSPSPEPPAPVPVYADAAELLRQAAARLRSLPRPARESRDGRRELAAQLGIDGPALLRAREQVGLSQRGLAEALGCARAQVAEAERGVRAPSPVQSRWAARVLRVKGGQS